MNPELEALSLTARARVAAAARRHNARVVAHQARPAPTGGDVAARCRAHNEEMVPRVDPSPQAAELGDWFDCPRLGCWSSALRPSDLFRAQLDAATRGSR